MSIVSSIRTRDPSCCLTSYFAPINAFASEIHEFFTHQKATLQKIYTLNQRVLQVEAQLCSAATMNAGMFGLKELLVEEAQIYNQKFLNRKIKKSYEKMRKNLERVHRSGSEQSIRAWAVADGEKISIARWILSHASQRHFAVYYHLDEVPLKYNEIPEGSIVLTDPYAYLKHMNLEKKFPIIHTIILKIKAVFCRLLTGKQFTHVGFAMGQGRMFELEKKSETWLRGSGLIKNCGDKVFYGVVLAPKQQAMLDAHNKRFPSAPCASFQGLIQKINREITQATENHRIQLDVFDIIKTVIPKRRKKDYAASDSWKGGACHYSCSGTTSALLSFAAGMDIGALYNIIDEKVTPTHFYHCREFYYPIYSIP